MLAPGLVLAVVMAASPLPARLLPDLTLTLPAPDGGGVSSAAAPATEARSEGTYALAYDNRIDLPLAGGSLLLTLLSEGPLKSGLAPSTCRWCDRATDGAEALNGLDAWGRGAKWADIETADTVSNVAAYGVALPLVLAAGAGTALRSHAAGELLEDGVIVAEAVGLDLLANQVAKFGFARERPFVHVLAPADKPLTKRPTDNDVSFWSGHTSFVWSLTFATATVAELRGYQDRWWIWAVGVPVCIAVPYLRMAADRHYLTDVLVGAAAGAAFGIGVPVLLHGRRAWRPWSSAGVTLNASVGPGGASVSGTF